MKSLFVKLVMLLSLLFFVQQAAYGKGRMLGKFTQAKSVLQKSLTAAAISLALVSGGMLAQAQEAQEQESPWTIVNEDAPQYDYLHNVFNLHVTQVEDPDKQLLFPLAYLGKSVNGEDVFIAYEKPAWTSMLEELATDVDLSLINYRGETWQDVSITEHVISKDQLDGFLDLIIISVAGADLAMPDPIQLGSFPFQDGGALVRVAGFQRQSYYPTMLPEEIELGASSFHIGTRNDCRVVVSPKWEEVGVGLHTCRGGGTAGFTGGMMVFYRHKLAAFQNAAVDTFAIVRGITPQDVDLAGAMLAGQYLPVEARGKLATTWGALKKE